MKRLLFFFFIFLTAILHAAPSCTAETRLAVLNMGKADCLLLMTDTESYLIDTGYEHTSNLLLECLRRYGTDRLNGVFLTHCDKDHYGGLERLARSDIQVDAWYAPEIYYNIPKEGHPLLSAAAERSDQVTWLRAGDTAVQSDEITIRVIGPLSVNTENENNNSLVFYAETADGTFLFTGDMKLEEETALMSIGAIGPADVLKVPFHGDNTASSESFVQRVNPEIALICTSTAEEPDTPASSVLKRYGRIGAQVYVTQDTRWGYETILDHGQAAVREIEWEIPEQSRSLQMRIDPKQDLLTLRNTGDREISLAGWLLYSTRGEECILLPEDALLPAGGEYSIGTRITTEDAALRLDMKRLWHKSKPDQAILYDTYGSIAATAGNGIEQ